MAFGGAFIAWHVRLPTSCHPQWYLRHALLHAENGQWALAVAVLRHMSERRVVPGVIQYSATVSACEVGRQWPTAVALLREMTVVCVATVNFLMLQLTQTRDARTRTCYALIPVKKK